MNSMFRWFRSLVVVSMVMFSMMSVVNGQQVVSIVPTWNGQENPVGLTNYWVGRAGGVFIQHYKDGTTLITGVDVQGNKVYWSSYSTRFTFTLVNAVLTIRDSVTTDTVEFPLPKGKKEGLKSIIISISGKYMTSNVVKTGTLFNRTLTSRQTLVIPDGWTGGSYSGTVVFPVEGGQIGFESVVSEYGNPF